MTTVVGGVGQLYQGDLDLGRQVVERLQATELGAQVVVEDFHYGAVAVSQRLEELAPDALILVGAEQSGRNPGSIRRRRVHRDPPDLQRARDSVEGAVTGYVTVDLVLDVIRALGTAPRRMVVFEVEPADTGPSTELSPSIAAAVEPLTDSVIREIEVTPLFLLAEEIEVALGDEHLEPSASLTSLQAILDGLEGFDRGKGWGEVFSARDKLRLDISDGRISESMSHLDWSLWWALIEELDRLQGEDATDAAI